jgi:hypothetical protein
VFRRKRSQRDADAAREDERRALFVELAERPEHVCPFLGLANARLGYEPEPSDQNRCYSFGNPDQISHEQQARVCLDRGYGNCPRYLRGILVIPTDEIEALRHPAAPRSKPLPPPPLPRPPIAVRPDRRFRFPVLTALLAGSVALLAAGVILIGQPLINGIAVGPTPSASPDMTPRPTATATPATNEPSPTASLSPTPTPEEPTPESGDRFSHYEVAVEPGTYAIFRVSQSGQITATSEANFSRSSRAPVAPRRASNGLVHWETTVGFFTGWSYIYPDSGDFGIRAVFLSPEGERRVRQLPDEDRTVYPSATPSP